MRFLIKGCILKRKYVCVGVCVWIWGGQEREKVGDGEEWGHGTNGDEGNDEKQLTIYDAVEQCFTLSWSSVCNGALS